MPRSYWKMKEQYYTLIKAIDKKDNLGGGGGGGGLGWRKYFTNDIK